MKLLRVAVCLLLALQGCAITTVEELSSLAEKPPLTYSVLLTGGGFVHLQTGADSDSPLARTYARAGVRDEVFSLKEIEATLHLARVFVATAIDDATPEGRHRVAALEHEEARSVPALRSLLERARRNGHDLLLVVERIHDGAVESRGVNDRWPFTIGAWLFALGLLVPDRTYESRALLRVSMRDVYTGRRVIGPILVEPGPVDLNMIERCGLWGFVQSILVPPFWTSTDPESIVESVGKVSTERIKVSLARRLKSAEVQEALARSGSAAIDVRRVRDGLLIVVDAKEALGTVALRLDGELLAPDFVRGFERALLASEEVDGQRHRYSALCRLPRAGRRLQVLVQTEAARISSLTAIVGRR